MKLIRSIVLAIGCFSGLVHSSISQTTDFSTVQLELEAATDTEKLLATLATVEPVPFAELPKNRLNRVSSVGFWSMQKPTMPPLPGNIFNLDVWPLGDGHFVLDDRNVDYAALQAAAELAAKLDAAATLKSPRTALRMMSSSLLSSAYGNPVYLTNLVVTTGPMTATFDIAGGTNNVPYDIQMSTNLAASNWNWLGIGYTSNRYSFSSQPSDLAFYRLAKPTKTMTVGFGDDTVSQCAVPYGLTNVLQVAGGAGHSLALKSDGTVVAWGWNPYGQATVPSGLTGVTMIAAGWYHSVALLTNGTLRTWGISDSPLYGGLRITNVPPDLTNVVVISSQAMHTLALRRDGTVVAWGYNTSFGETNVPAGLSNVVAIAAGYQHSLAVTTNGAVVAWGRNNYGQGTVPAGLSNVVDVAAGAYHSLALKRDGTVVAWGDNDAGEATVPAGLSNVVAIAASADPFYSGLDVAYSLALKSDGSVVAWGNNAASDPVGGLENVIGIAAGLDHALALRTGPATPVITLEPIDQFQVQGSNATFTARGAGLYGVSYQWQTNTVNLPGATNATLTVTNVQPLQLSNSFRVVVANEVGSIASSNAYLHFVTPPIINSLTLPTNQVAIYLTNLVLFVTASAPGQYDGFPLAYQWQFNGTNLAGATGSSYTVHATATAFGTYSVLVSNAAGSTNVAWNVSIYYPSGLAITQQPTNQYQIAGGTISFYGGGVGSNSVAYQWQFNGTNLVGATNATLTLTNVQAAQQGTYNFVVTVASNSLTSSNATFTLITPPVITSQSTPTNRVCIEGNYLSFAATFTAPRLTNGFPIAYHWQFNGTNITGFSSTNYTTNASVSGVYSLLASNAAGTTAANWQVTVTNAINVTNDLLLIYNTNSTDSKTVLDYYLAHRPNIGGANVLGIGFSGFVITNFPGNGDWVGATNLNNYETITPAGFTNQILNPVLTWLTNNSAKKPQYVVLMLDVPARICDRIPNYDPVGDPYLYPGSNPFKSVSVQLNQSVTDWQPFVTHLNMGATNDCIGYINKLVTLGTNVLAGSPLLSASAAGYGNTNWCFDDANGLYSINPFALQALQGVTSNGVSMKNINFQSFSDTQITKGTNLAGYVSWGSYNLPSPRFPVNGMLNWYGQSGWWLIETIESFNGTRYVASQSNYMLWFSANSFGGSNYSNTPIGAVSHTDEPSAAKCEDSNIYFGLWAAGKSFGICAWNARRTPHFQAIGDPFVTR